MCIMDFLLWVMYKVLISDSALKDKIRIVCKSIALEDKVDLIALITKSLHQINFIRQPQ